MSGLPERQQLLSGLASGAVDLVKSQQLAQQVQAKQAAQGGGGSSGGGSTQPRTPEQRYDNLQIIKAARDDGLITDGDTRAAALNQVGIGDSGTGGSGDAGTPAATRTAWPTLDAKQVLPRIKELTGDPDKFSQGTARLCTAAVFYHHVIQRAPAQFRMFAEELYRGGLSFIGKLKVAPGKDLRSASYAALAARDPRMPPQAEWMLMSALRDSENWFFDYQGDPDEWIASRTYAKELSEWYENTGFYTSVAFSDDPSPGAIKSITKKTTNHIALCIRVSPLPGYAGRSDGHVITVEGPITINEAADSVTFKYWSWASVQTLTTSFTLLKANYLGVITATF